MSHTTDTSHKHTHAILTDSAEVPLRLEKRPFYESPLWSFVVIGLSIFVADLIAMIIMRFLKTTLSEPLYILIDSALLLLLLSPLFYFYLTRLSRHRAEDHKFAEEVSQAAMIKQYKTFIDTSMDAFWLFDVEGRILDVNSGLTIMTGYSKDELVNMTIYDVTAKEDHGEITKRRETAMKTGSGRFESRYHMKNGTVIDIEVSMTYSPKYNYIYAFVRDITERKINETKLRKAREELEERVYLRTLELKKANEQLALRSTETEKRNLEISRVSKMGELLSVCATIQEAYPVISSAASHLFPDHTGALFVLNSSRNLLEPEAVWGDPSAVHESINPQSCWALRRGRCYSADDLDAGLRCPHLLGFGRGHFCLPLMAHGETLGVLHLSKGTTATQDHSGDGQETFSLLLNASEKIEIAIANLKLGEALRNLSVRDPLTGLFNRRFMEESLEREYALATRKGLTVGIIMLDIDHFKRFNDTFGHEAGDALLRQLGTVIKQHVRGSDIACRYGGEEFTIIMPDASLKILSERAEQLRAEVTEMHVHYDHTSLGSVTISLGIAIFPDHGSSTQAVLRASDEALYKAKRNGRNQVCIYTENADIDEVML